MLPGRRDAEGRLDVTADLPDSTSTLHGGIAVNSSGQVHITNVITGLFSNGFMVTGTGQLCFGQAPIDGGYLEGLPRKADGRLVGQADTVPAATDPFLGGVRIGPLGGIYTTYVIPPTGDAPVNTVRPDVTGDAVVGATLTCSQGTWTGTAPITYTYKWYQNNTPIVGANTATYVIQAGDLGTSLHCVVTATNAIGGENAVSQGVPVISARYDYKNNAGVPMTGVVSAGSAGAPLQVRINEIDKDGVDHFNALNNLQIGDSIFVDTQEGVLTELPIETSGYFILEMAVWPLLADGEYLVKLGYNP